MRATDPAPDFGRSRLLHFGCGPHFLPAPWENFDAEIDISLALPFPATCAAYIVAEHVIEHVPFAAGMEFLRQCYRLLDFGGVLRLAFPDVTRLDESNLPLYLDFLDELRPWPLPTHGGRATEVQAYRFILEGSEHVACWTERSGVCALLAAGFSVVEIGDYGRSDHHQLDGIDGHHLTSTLTAATIETTVLEATK